MRLLVHLFRETTRWHEALDVARAMAAVLDGGQCPGAGGPARPRPLVRRAEPPVMQIDPMTGVATLLGYTHPYSDHGGARRPAIQTRSVFSESSIPSTRRSRYSSGMLSGGSIRMTRGRLRA